MYASPWYDVDPALVVALNIAGPFALAALKFDVDTFMSWTMSESTVCTVPEFVWMSVSETPSIIVARPVGPRPFAE
jgi:hypothetical protein